MADRELASKLAQRVNAMGEAEPPPPPSIPPPPVPADPPKEHHPNPFVAPADVPFSIDDFVLAALESNNNHPAKPTPPPLPASPPPPLPSKAAAASAAPAAVSAHPPMVPLVDAARPESPVAASKQPQVRVAAAAAAGPTSPRPQTPTFDRKGFPPMVPLVEPERPESPVPISKQPLVRLQKGAALPAVPLSPPAVQAPPLPASRAPAGAPPMISLVEEDRPQSPLPVPKQPVVRVERGTNLPVAPVQKQKFVSDPGDGGAELEKRLEAQRLKKNSEAPPVPNFDPILREIERLERSVVVPPPPQIPPPFIPGVSMPPPPPAFKPPPVPEEAPTTAAPAAEPSAAAAAPVVDAPAAPAAETVPTPAPAAEPEPAVPEVPVAPSDPDSEAAAHYSRLVGPEAAAPAAAEVVPEPTPAPSDAPFTPEFPDSAPEAQAPPPPPPIFEAPPPPPPSLISAAASCAETTRPTDSECAAARAPSPSRPAETPPTPSASSPPPLPPPKTTVSVSDSQSDRMVMDTAAPLSALDTNANGLKVIPKPSPASTCSSSDDSDELAAKLARRNMINEGEAAPQMITKGTGVYNEFPEFSRKQIKYFTETFKKYDEDADNFIDFMELKRMMEKLGEPQTHVALKTIIKKVDEDQDGKVSLREFLLIFRYAAGGELGVSSEVFKQLADSIDVTKEGVHGAAEFFQAKIAEQSKLSKFEEEIKAEQEEKKREEEEKKERRKKFLENKSIFH